MQTNGRAASGKPQLPRANCFYPFSLLCWLHTTAGTRSPLQLPKEKFLAAKKNKTQKLSPGDNLSRKFPGISLWHNLQLRSVLLLSCITHRCFRTAASSLPSLTLHRELIHSLRSPCCCSGDSRKDVATSLTSCADRPQAQSVCRSNSTLNSTALLLRIEIRV